MAEVTVQDWLAALRFGGYRKINGETEGDTPIDVCALGVRYRLIELASTEAQLATSAETGEFLQWRAERGYASVPMLNDFEYEDDVTFDRLADELEADYIEWKEQR